jgi:hypothetical protein
MPVFGKSAVISDIVYGTFGSRIVRGWLDASRGEQELAKGVVRLSRRHHKIRTTSCSGGFGDDIIVLSFS